MPSPTPVLNVSLNFIYDNEHNPKNYTEKFLGFGQSYYLNTPRGSLSFAHGYNRDKLGKIRSADMTYLTYGIGYSYFTPPSWGGGTSSSVTFDFLNIITFK